MAMVLYCAAGAAQSAASGEDFGEPSTATPPDDAGGAPAAEGSQNSPPAAPARPPQPSKAASLSAKVSRRDAEAEKDAPMFGTFEGTYGLGGLALGATFGPRGYYVGGELSVVRQFREFAWLGGYIDGVYDFGRKQTRLSVGPEFGWSALGLDGGYLLALDDAGQHSGLTVRPLLTIGYATGYARLSHLFGGQTWLEAGVLLKYPVEL